MADGYVAPQVCWNNRTQPCFKLLDVRTAVEYRAVHAEGARNIPIDQLDPDLLKGEGCNLNDPIYVICKAGSRGKKAHAKLVDAGFTHVWNVEGGTDAWCAENLPVVRGKAGVSLMRQVQMIAGSMVAIGSAMALFVDPSFAFLSGFVGCGLLFAGISNCCPMATLLGRAPWNQVQAISCTRS